MSLNQVTLMGNLTRDVDFKVFESGACVAQFGLAINEVYRDSDGEKQERVTFVDIETWNRQAEIASEHLHKGKRVVITGSLKYDSWEDEETQQKRSKLSVRAYRIIFAETKAEEEARTKNQGFQSGAPMEDPGVRDDSASAAGTPTNDGGTDDGIPF